MRAAVFAVFALSAAGALAHEVEHEVVRGRAIALRLGAEGVKVGVFDINPNSAAETVKAIEAAGGQAMAATCEVWAVMPKPMSSARPGFMPVMSGCEPDRKFEVANGALLDR